MSRCLTRISSGNFQPGVQVAQSASRNTTVSWQAGTSDAEESRRWQRASSQRRVVRGRAEGHRACRFSCGSLAEAPAPVIFDDPINSLDYRRMTEVVNRIAALSDTRQVIVFTHNIWFTTELLARFEKRTQDCSYYDVRATGQRSALSVKGRILVPIHSPAYAAESTSCFNRRRRLRGRRRLHSLKRLTS